MNKVDLNSQDINLNLISLDKFEQLPQKQQCENETRHHLKKRKRKIQEKKSISTTLDKIASTLAAAESTPVAPTSTPAPTSVPLSNNDNVITKNISSPPQPPKSHAQLTILPKSQPPPFYPPIITHPLNVPKFQLPMYYPPQINTLYSQNPPLFYPPKETQPLQIKFEKEKKPQPLPIIDPKDRKQIVFEKPPPKQPISAPNRPCLYYPNRSNDPSLDYVIPNMKIESNYAPASLPSTESWFDHLNSLSSFPRAHENNYCIAIDCEMVGVGEKGKSSALARVSIVNYYGEVILNEYVRPTREITDYRTEFSGITPELLVNANGFKEVQKEVKRIMRGHIVVGQSIHFDFKALKTGHPKHLIRDTSCYNAIFGSENDEKGTPSLKKLAKNILGIDIQEGEHDSIEDARASMILYRHRQAEWEQYLKTNGFPKPKGCKICGSFSHVVRDCALNKKNYKNGKNGKIETDLDTMDTNMNNLNLISNLNLKLNSIVNIRNDDDMIDYDEFNRDPNTSKYYSYSNPIPNYHNNNNSNSYFSCAPCAPYAPVAYPYNYNNVNRVTFG